MFERYKILRQWEKDNKFYIELEKYGILYTLDENSFTNAISDGYLEINVEDKYDFY